MQDIPAFKVIEPDGRTYQLFAEGRIEGFAPGASMVNYVPTLIALAVAESFVPSEAELACIGELIEGVSVHHGGFGGAPSDEFVQIDFDPDSEIAAAFPVALQVLTMLAPILVVERKPPTFDYDGEKGRIIFRRNVGKDAGLREPGAEV